MSTSTSPPPTSPSPRNILTSLLTTLSAIPSPTPIPSSTTFRSHPGPGQHTSEPANALHVLSASQKTLFATLHVLLPSILLPALDLLDRGRVTRLVVTSSPPDNTEIEGPPQAQFHLPPTSGSPSSSYSYLENRNVIYQVTSSSIPKSRFHSSTTTNSTFSAGTTTSGLGAGGQTYTVRLPSWNCTCAAFAFSAFSPSTSQSTTHAPSSFPSLTSSLTLSHTGKEDSDRAKEFGGLSFDGCAGGDGRGGRGGNVPVCKHLLACLLGERVGVLGRYVTEREVGREEMCGVVAGG